MENRSASQDELTAFKNRSFIRLFLTEMGERFAYYSISSLFVLYLSHQMMLSDSSAYSIFFTFSSLLFIMPPLGGYIAEKYLNCQTSLIIGIVMLGFGYGVLVFPGQQFFYLGLSIIIVGQGFFKSMPYLLLGKVFADESSSLDSRYTKYYLSINIGGIPALMCSGMIAKYCGYGFAFGISAMGMLLSLFVFLPILSYLKTIGIKDTEIMMGSIVKVFVGTIVTVSVVFYLMFHRDIVEVVVAMTAIGIIFYTVRCSFKLSAPEKKNLIYLMFFISFSVLFFAFWNQQPTSLSLFIDRNVSRSFFGINIPASSFWLFNPFWIVIVTPVLVWIYGKQKSSIANMGNKFVIGLGMTSASYWSIVVGCRYFSHDGMISAYWIGISYLFLAIGELLISALGASMVVKYSPGSMRNFMMGVWFFASSAAGIVAEKFAKMTDVPLNNDDQLFSMHVYQHAFSIFGVVSIIAMFVAWAGFTFLAVEKKQHWRTLIKMGYV